MNKHLNNWLDKMDGLPENTSNNNIQKEIDRCKTQSPSFYDQLIKDGFEPNEHVDDKTGEPFIGWSVKK